LNTTGLEYWQCCRFRINTIIARIMTKAINWGTWTVQNAVKIPAPVFIWRKNKPQLEMPVPYLIHTPYIIHLSKHCAASLDKVSVQGSTA
jgi:hypothetical protein